MTFSVNDSPLAGREGDKVTSRMIRARLWRELKADVSGAAVEKVVWPAFPLSLRASPGKLFETADDMATAEAALDAMDPGETPGTRASIDRCEIKAELGPS